MTVGTSKIASYAVISHVILSFVIAIIRVRFKISIYGISMSYRHFTSIVDNPSSILEIE